MENAKDNDAYPLKRSAQRELHRILDELEDLLVARARSFAEGRPIGPDDLGQAYSVLGYPNREIENAQMTITRTLRENRVTEWVAYSMALVLFSVGIVLLLVGAFGSPDVYRVSCIISGSVVEMLLLLPFRFAVNCRRHNIAIRMLGILLDRVDDPKKLTTILKNTFLAVVVGNAPAQPK